MPTLIIPDIHEELDIFRKILRKYSHIPNKIFLGDMADSFTFRGPEHIIELFKEYKEFVEDTDHVALLGNHDMQYAYPDIQELLCSGFQPWKIQYIQEQMGDTWHKVKIHHWIETPYKTWLLSHAGYHESFLKGGLNPVSLDIRQNIALKQLQNKGEVSSLFRAGRARGGYNEKGGPTWLDWNHEFVAVPGLNQIVGHTKSRGMIRSKFDNNSENWCIDTEAQHIGIIDDDGTFITEKI